MAEEPYRLFVAVPLPAAAIEACRSLIDVVRAAPAGRGPRWVGMQNLHLTLRFLGEVSPGLVPAVADAIRAGVGGHRSFPVVLAGSGAFPAGRKVRALWLGIEDGAPELAAIARALDAPLAGLGWPAAGRPFQPHLTVARTDATSVAGGLAAAAALAGATAGWRVMFTADRVTVVRSQLGAGTPRYEPLAEFALAG